MTYRPFEAFCRSHFVDSTGNLQALDSDSREARRKRNERKRNELSYQLRGLQKTLNELYRKGLEVREEKGEVSEVQEIFQQAGRVRRNVAVLRDELKKVKDR